MASARFFFCQFIDIGDGCSVDVNVLHPKIREFVMDSLRNEKKQDHSGTRQKSGLIR